MTEDWDDYEIGVCDHCGRTARVILSDDPYIREIWPEDENEDSYWCYVCYDNRSADI